MSDVFISYARPTERTAHAIAESLRALGYSVWRDDDLPAHRPYAEVIEERLDLAKAVVVVWSADAVKSQWVQSEADRARQDDKLVQINLDHVRLPMPFDRIQCADLIGWDGASEHSGWRKAVASVAALAGAPLPGAGPAAVADVPEAPAYTNNLPRRQGATIGRDAEVADLAALLRGADLVTITGTGGVGKTRVAIEVGALQTNDYEDGVWLAELAPVSDPEQVPGAVARTMNIDLPPGQDLLKALVDRLRPRSCLIILDNCEHVIDAVAQLAEAVLDSSPGVKMLASSQELLGVDGEQVFRLRSLGEVDAVTLFTERAHAADAGFAMTAEDAVAAGAICQRLDGIPLAIEMAAARAPALGCAGVLQRLDDRFRVLTGGRRTALPRQRTLLATLDWSHGLLIPRDAAVFRCLGIFTGGFSLEAASEVAADASIDAYDVVDGLSSLVAKSLVVAEPGDGRPRYRLLETTRAYALEKLDAAGETIAMQRRHAEYFLKFVDPIGADYYGPVSDDMFAARYHAEIDNIDRAIDWAFGPTGDADLGIALVAGSAALWATRSLYPDYLRWLEIAAPRISADTPETVRAQFLVARVAAFMMNNQAQALGFADEAIAAARTSADRHLLPEALNAKGFSLLFNGRLAEARVVCDESLAVTAGIAHSRLTAQTRDLDAYLTWVEQGDTVARPMFDSLIADLRTIGASGLANFFFVTSSGTLSREDPDAAVGPLREVLRVIRPSEMLSGLATSVAAMQLAGALIARDAPGDLDEAIGVARTFQKSAGGMSVFVYLLVMAQIFVRRGRPRDAAKLAGLSDSLRAETGNVLFVAMEDSADTWALISAELGDDELAALRVEGANMSLDDAFRLAASVG